MENNKEEILRELKADLRSLVISTTTAMRVTDLVKDYYEQNGRNIPVRDFGCNSVEEFLRSKCTDVVMITDTGRNPVLHPIVTESSRKINSLISKQKIVNLRKPRRTTVDIRDCNAMNNKSPIKHHPSDPKLYISGVDMFKNNSNSSAFNNNRSRECRTPVKNSTTKTPSATPGSENYKNVVLRNLIVLVNENPAGIWVAQLMNEYSKKFDAELSYRRLGFDSAISYCTTLHNIFTINRPSTTSDWKLYPRSHKAPNIPKEKNKTTTKAVAVTSVEKNIFGEEALPGISIDPSLYPDDCLGYIDTIKRLQLPTCDEHLEVYVSEVIDPSYFWFNIRSITHSRALERLMSDMDNFYKSNPNTYKMVRAMIRVGQFCAVPYNNDYHRALVIFNVDMYNVKVFYIDYGTISIVKTDDFRLLKREFAELPIQALRGRLAGVKPCDNQWPLSAGHRFLNLVENKALFANVVDVKKDIMVSVLELVDTSKDDVDIFIGKTLIEEGIAKSETEDSLVSNLLKRLSISTENRSSNKIIPLTNDDIF